MPKVSTYTLLTASGIDRTADSLYVVDATGPADKRATVRDAYLACLGAPVVTDATTSRVLSKIGRAHV